MERSKARENVQRHLVRPLLDKMPKGKAPGHRKCLRTAGLAIANVVLDKRVPLDVVRRDLEDLREAIDFAIGIVSMGQKNDSLH